MTDPAPSTPAPSSTPAPDAAATKPSLISEPAKPAADAKAPAPEAKKPDAAPQATFDSIKFPDDVSAKDAKAFIDFAKEMGFTPEAAQKFFEHSHSKATEAQKSQQTAFQKQIDAGIEAIEKDPVLGGDNYEKTLVTARNGLNTLVKAKVVGPEFVQKLEKTGLYADPDMVKIMHYLGKSASEPTTIISGSGSGSATPNLTTEQKLVQAFSARKE
jgi:hypothetical protein